MLEAMACGTPVAAFPVTGPLDVLGTSDGGVARPRPARRRAACAQVPRATGRAARALQSDWRPVCEQFQSGHLGARRQRSEPETVTENVAGNS
jgi:glycosyltransferase involved in cell wall biosynthesis